MALPLRLLALAVTLKPGAFNMDTHQLSCSIDSVICHAWQEYGSQIWRGTTPNYVKTV